MATRGSRPRKRRDGVFSRYGDKTPKHDIDQRARPEIGSQDQYARQGGEQYIPHHRDT